MASQKTGKLTIAGSGIASIGHITLETLSYIENADKLYYCVTDPGTEAFLQSRCKGEHFDLTVYYDKQKNRYESYVQMCEVMLREVRAGHNVVGIFYGHPGVFVSPSHRAIALALNEGYDAKMLPGISAEDYMFSDLGFDPAIPGCTTQEATGLLLSKKKLDPSVHNIIWQVGAVGVPNMMMSNTHFHFLVDRLEEDFGPDHEVVHYIGAVLPQAKTIKDKYKISDLRKPEVENLINSTSTFYIAPKTFVPLDQEMMKTIFGSSVTIKEVPKDKTYGELELTAVSELATHSVPEGRRRLHGSRAIHKFLEDLALNPDLRDKYKADPAAIVETVPGLSEAEKHALITCQSGPLRRLLYRSSSEEPAVGEVLAEPERLEIVIVTIIILVPAALKGIQTPTVL